MDERRAQTVPCREGFAWHPCGDYRVHTAAIRRCCKDTDFSYKTKRTRLIYTPLLRAKVAPDGGEGCTRWARLFTDFPTTAPPVESFLRHHAPKLGRLQKNLLRFSENLQRFSENLLRFSENLQRFSENLQRFSENLQRFSENLQRFFRLYAAIFFLSLPQLKIND